MKKIITLFLTLTLFVGITSVAMAEDLYYYNNENVEELFFERYGYNVDVTVRKGLPNDPEGWFFRIPGLKNMRTYYLSVEAFSDDGSTCYISGEKLQSFFERNNDFLKRHTWENVEEPYKYYKLEDVSDILLKELKVTDRLTMTVDSDDDFFTISVVKDGIELNVEFGSLWRKEIAEGEFIYHQAVVTELFQQWLNATAGN